MLGERVPAAQVGERGLDGDRLWAVRDPDGKFGSGKNTRRFRRMPGLFQFRGYAAAPAPVVELPDGRRFAADDPAGHRANDPRGDGHRATTGPRPGRRHLLVDMKPTGAAPATGSVSRSWRAGGRCPRTPGR
ncbi:hypothetical protein AMIS_25440 [Actinoplanes missouriensis 431]|uniref:Uncharacterized protein n=1 Tax=Actinoplanes missouriensis (strain ATCC 14538 / DSM 43046 / CBS 188.64 / JCM 3121 / NBRC 102363 / NCIMB 12654 / NRRL B-3342 / UNCC 431) TaxID=512565 RepID=I0H427_ACTM4|nr:hypothetical protein [Actinoplanes missouriensis]BAL87764.1 hypothetical protein AMIS_25440 [Actinoplanes missouriensis 431]